MFRSLRNLVARSKSTPQAKGRFFKTARMSFDTLEDRAVPYIGLLAGTNMPGAGPSPARGPSRSVGTLTRAAWSGTASMPRLTGNSVLTMRRPGIRFLLRLSSWRTGW